MPIPIDLPARHNDFNNSGVVYMLIDGALGALWSTPFVSGTTTLVASLEEDDTVRQEELDAEPAKPRLVVSAACGVYALSARKISAS